MTHGALLLHGFTATPECLESLAEPLRKKGFAVEAPFLAGHGSTPSDLLNTTRRDWYHGVSRAFEKLERKCGSVSMAGLSLGGLLALKLATEHRVKKLALLATPVFFTGLMERYLLPVVGNTPLKWIYPYQPKWMGPAIRDPVGRREFKSYSKMPIKSIMEIVRLQKELVPKLQSIRVPTLIIHSHHDTTAPYENMAYLEKNLGSKIIRTVTLEKSDHVLTMDYEKELVAREVVQFFGGKK